MTQSKKFNILPLRPVLGLAAGLAVLLTSGVSIGQTNPPAQPSGMQPGMQGSPPSGGMMMGGMGQHHMPPPQAFEDCKGKAEGTSVMHRTPEGQVSAKCMMSPQGMVARPDRPPPGAMPPPPPGTAPPKN